MKEKTGKTPERQINSKEIIFAENYAVSGSASDAYRNLCKSIGKKIPKIDSINRMASRYLNGHLVQEHIAMIREKSLENNVAGLNDILKRLSEIALEKHPDTLKEAIKALSLLLGYHKEQTLRKEQIEQRERERQEYDEHMSGNDNEISESLKDTIFERFGENP